MGYFKHNHLLLGTLIIIFSIHACSDVTSENQSENEIKNLFSFNKITQEAGRKSKRTNKIKSRPEVEKVNIAQLTSQAYSIFREKQKFNFNVSASKKFQIQTTKITKNKNGSTSLIGELVDSYGHAVLVLTPKGISGTLRTRDWLYKIEPSFDDLTTISLIDETKFPKEHDSEIPLGPNTNFSSDDKSYEKQKNNATQEVSIQSSDYAPNGGPTHGVLFLYTQSVDNNTADIVGLIQTAIDETNQIYANSNVVQNVYAAHSTQTNYDESGRSYSEHGYALRDSNDGMMDNVPTLREQYNADLVVLLVDDSDACGWAYIGAHINSAFAVVNYTCATGYYTFAHEIGHLYGARHDRAVDDTDTPYEYGHGYVDPNDNWRTVMAYSDACGGCSRVPYWSNPDVNYPPTGQAMGTHKYENNARAVANRGDEFRDFYTLDGPTNFTFTNEGSNGESPHFTWNSNSDADVTKVWRCIDDLSTSTSECDYSDSNYRADHYQYPDDPEEYTDHEATIGGLWEICTTNYVTKYYVTSKNYTGETGRPSDDSQIHSECVEL